MHYWVGHYLAKYSLIIGHCIFLPILGNFLINSFVHKSSMDYIFVWFTEEDINEIFHTQCQIACYKDGTNLYPYQKDVSRLLTLESSF